MANVFQLTADFAVNVLGLHAPKFPTRLNHHRKAWTIGALREETQEFQDAETIEDEIDALEDLIYFAAGRLHEMGVDGAAHFLEVHRPNLLKKRGELSKRPGSQGYDAIKPDGWTGPDHSKLLATRPKIILLGHARHGKDTVAELLRDRHGFAFQSSSMFCAEKVMMPWFTNHGYSYDAATDRTFRPYHTAEECYADRVNFRDIWYDQISLYNVPDKARLCRELFETNDIYVGMRAVEEFRAAQSLAQVVIWVDASGRGLPPEGSDSCTVTEEMADFTMSNNGTLEDLAQAVDAFVAKLERVE